MDVMRSGQTEGEARKWAAQQVLTQAKLGMDESSWIW